ncbi:MAG: GAF domain-containing protein [Actinomycetia bacterium]|nr:GAF domain-containing protein [Actinomycetes bacterium]
MPDDHGLVEALTTILESLRQATRSQRVTLRIDVPARDIHVDRALVEVRDPGVPAIQADTSLKQRQLATVRHLEATRDLLVQNDCRQDPISPPPELMAVYGVRAQILAPLLGADRTLAGWISVHDTVAPRMWTPHEEAMVREITARVRRMLEDAGWL